MTTLEAKPLLKCLNCNQQFTLLDVREGTIVGLTGICMECYGVMSKDAGTCFGKKNEKGTWGYDDEAIECRCFCPDSQACRQFIKNPLSKKFNP